MRVRGVVSLGTGLATLSVAGPASPLAYAGSILQGRSGSSSNGATAGGGINNPATDAAARAGMASRESGLAKTVQALQAMQSMQEAARAAAKAGTGPVRMNPNRPSEALPAVPNGLTVGGLQVAPEVPVDLAKPGPGEISNLWVGAKLPKQEASGASGNGARVTVEQTAPQALLRWKTFNVGADTELHFDQRAGGSSAKQWTAFNHVADPSGAPSQILGKLTADGQVYVINANGILFGAGSQVNLPSLVASSLPINMNLVANGLLNNPDSQFLFSGLPIASGANGTPAFNPDSALVPNGWFGDVKVERGARLSTPTSADKVGGRIALIGANVVNEGTISTPEGQVILASGLQVGFGAHVASDPSLRGLDVFVGEVSSTNVSQPRAGSVRNGGVVEVLRGNLVMTGREVFNAGIVESSTSVALNGRIELIAGYGAVPNPQSFSAGASASVSEPFLLRYSGSVELGLGSVIRILPETASQEAVVGTRLALDSVVNLRGRVIHFGGDSALLAPSGRVVLDAGEWKYQGGPLPVSPFLNTAGQVYLDSGAWIDVAGSAGIELPVTRNVVEVELRGTELADSPLQRDGILRGKTIRVDMRNSGVWQGKRWVGTPLADASGYIGLIQRRVGELTTTGGSVAMRAGASVVMQLGSKVDVSGGWVSYEGGIVETTKVMTSGRVLDISQATPDLVYDGIYSESTTVRFDKYGVVEGFMHPLPKTAAVFEPGYYEGASGGSLTISAPSVALDGTLQGSTIAGRLQRANPPTPSRFNLELVRRSATPPLFIVESPTPPEVRFDKLPRQGTVPAFRVDDSGHEVDVPLERKGLVLLPTDLVGKSGFGSVAVYNPDGDVVVPSGVGLTLSPWGGLTLDGANIRVDGTMEGSSGTVQLRARSISPSGLERLMTSPDGAMTPPAGAGRGLILVGPTAKLNVSGVLADDRVGREGANFLPLSLAGGELILNGLDVRLAAGSVLDVSGGARVLSTGNVVYGGGGSLTISGGHAGSVAENPVLAGVLGGGVVLDGELRGFSGVSGAALRLSAPRVVLGGTNPGNGALHFGEEFFKSGGFRTYSIGAFGSIGATGPIIRVAENARLETGAVSRVLDLSAGGLAWKEITMPEGVRQAGVLEFHADGSYDAFTRLPIVRGDLQVGAGSRIRVEAGGSLVLAGDTVTMLGALEARGGAVSVRGSKDSNAVFPELAAQYSKALPTVFFGAGSSVDARGDVVLAPDAHGYRQGRVLSGGTVTLSGNVVADAGAVFDVSGSSAVLDLAVGLGREFSGGEAVASALLPGRRLVPTVVETNGGTITVSSAQMLLLDGTFRGLAGGAMARGGALSVASGLYFGVGAAVNQTALDVTLEVSQSQRRVYVETSDVVGKVMVDGSGVALSSFSGVSVNGFAAGGFDVIRLDGTIRAQGNVLIRAGRELAIASGGVIHSESSIQLDAPHVVLGTPFRQPFGLTEDRTPFFQGIAPFFFGAKYGTGSLKVTGTLVDVGNLSLQGIGNMEVLANTGDLRGNGTLDLAGNLKITAGQIYPPTATRFVIGVSDYFEGGETRSGSIEIVAGSGRASPLSAGGELSLYAGKIVQAGTLVAPFGRITVGWDGLGTAPRNAISGKTYAITSSLEVKLGGRISVAGVDGLDATALRVPYGILTSAREWVDPMGVDVSATGLPLKQLTLGGRDVQVDSGAVLDIRGGGDAFAYRWISGVGGTQDLLGQDTGFAVVPGYGLEYAPYAPFTTDPSARLLSGARGYVGSGIHVGDSVVLEGGPGLAAGTYTLLPARYAVLPGAFLVTQRGGVPSESGVQPDGTVVMRGYTQNVMARDSRAPSLTGWFDVQSGAVVGRRAEYEVAGATEFLGKKAVELGVIASRSPQDAGHLRILSANALRFAGAVFATAPERGRGGLVDFGVAGDVVVAGKNEASRYLGGSLDASTLTGFGAESLLVGGVRTFSGGAANVSIRAKTLTVDNASSPLRGLDLVLVATDGMTVASAASIVGFGEMSSVGETLRIGDAAVSGSGNGVLVRVGGVKGGSVERQGLDLARVSKLSIGESVTLSGERVLLAATGQLSLGTSARLQADVLEVSGGRVSLQLDGEAALRDEAGLVLTRSILDGLASSRKVTLQSFSSLDLVGAGTYHFAGELLLGASQLRGYGQAGAKVELGATTITFAGGTNVGAAPASDAGVITLNAGLVRTGGGSMSVENFTAVELNATQAVTFEASGSLAAVGALTVKTPVVGALGGVEANFAAGGTLKVEAAGGAGVQTVSSGFGASVGLTGSSVVLTAPVELPGGSLSISATNGGVELGGRVGLGGVCVSLRDLNRFVDGGSLRISSSTADVVIQADALLDLAAATGGGNAGRVSVSAPNGKASFLGRVVGTAGSGGEGGSFSLDVRDALVGGLSGLGEALATGGFTARQEIRFRNGDVLVDGELRAHEVRLAADNGSIVVDGSIDASGLTGGRIALVASGDVRLAPSAVLKVSAQTFDAAGKGGVIRLEAGSQRSGSLVTGAMLRLESGARLDLSVAEAPVKADQFSGVLQLRAPVSGGTDIGVDSIRSQIVGASAISVEGFRIYQLSGVEGLVDTTLQGKVRSDAQAWLGVSGSASAGYAAMLSRLAAGDVSLSNRLVLMPGAELVHATGNIRFTADWDLSGYRFGPLGAPGALTIRAQGNISMESGGLSDGFTSSAYTATLQTPNALLPLNLQSWSYRLVAGADGATVDSLRTMSGATGSVLLGKDGGANISLRPTSGLGATLVGAISGRFQVIRTGSGDIDVRAAGDVRFLNPFAAIYTAGVRVAEPTRVRSSGDFDVPILRILGTQGTLGAVPWLAVAQYSLAGGDVAVSAGNDLVRLTLDSAGKPIADSSRQLPMNWLYRRGFVDAATGTFGKGDGGEVASTTWWVDYTNFFQTVGALGGGNVRMVAGRDLMNVDAVLPTNARMAKGVPSLDGLVEYGGGDLSVRAGRDISGGVFYVEKGTGTLSAGGKVTTNATRSVSLTNLRTPEQVEWELSWMPTTLFVGKSKMEVSARGDVLLGPVANPFLLPAGVGNTFWYKTYFSTYSPSSSVSAISLGGDVTMRRNVTFSADAGSQPLLLAWMERQLLLTGGTLPSASFFQPWLRLSESQVAPFRTVAGVMPPSLSISALTGDVNLVGDLTLSPSSVGGLSLFAAGSVNGLQPNGVSNQLVPGTSQVAWAASVINVSDANPALLPSVALPYAYRGIVGTSKTTNLTTENLFLSPVDRLFAETGATAGAADSLQVKQALHASGLLHLGDAEPVRLYAGTGDISGITLYAPKMASIQAGRDVTDFSLYGQNLVPTDRTVVGAGRDVVLYQPNSPLRVQSRASGNSLNFGQSPMEGDLQLGGPGTLEIFTGRDFTLGVGQTSPLGTGLGVTTIGNQRNPYLPTDGARVIIGAGIPGGGLASGVEMDAFLSGLGSERTGQLLKAIGAIDSEGSPVLTTEQFEALDESDRKTVGLGLFFRVLRDSGRAAGDARYLEGSAAVETVFGAQGRSGNVTLTSRGVKTRSGGDVSILAPFGDLTVGVELTGNSAQDQGVLTEAGGNISIFVNRNVNVGTSRIFTLRGGNEVIWASLGNIAAGASSKTVQAAPPTRVVIDTQTGSVKTDLAGLATGGGIGVLTSVAGIAPGDIDLIAPKGFVDAGDAGIRVSGNLNIAAVQVLNSSNIQVSGASAGVPAAPVSVSVSAGAMSVASSTTSATVGVGGEGTKQTKTAVQKEEVLSIISVEVVGYGGGDSSEDEEKMKKKAQ